MTAQLLCWRSRPPQRVPDRIQFQYPEKPHCSSDRRGYSPRFAGYCFDLSTNREGRRLDVCVSFIVLATRVPECNGVGWLRSPLPDYLGQEHICLGFRQIQTPTRTNLLCARRRRKMPGKG